MKRFLGAILLVALALTVVSCGSEKGAATSAISAAETAWTAARDNVMKILPTDGQTVEDAIAAAKASLEQGDAKAALAAERGCGLHVDACLGGFVLPWAERLGYSLPPFDFRVPGVTSMSVDTHKYGYAAKGTSVVLYRDAQLRRHQYFATADWPGGLYFSPTLAGSRPGALSAACWAALATTGREGYREAARRILETGAAVKAGIRAIPGLHVLGEPLWVVAFGARDLDIYRVLDRMTARGWSLNGLHRPACVHLCVTLRHTRPGVAQRFLTDLRAAVDDLALGKRRELEQGQRHGV
mgnify:CR=1 FL=1